MHLAPLPENRAVRDLFGAESTKLLTGTQGYQATTTRLRYKSRSPLPHILRKWNQSELSESVLVQPYRRLGAFFGRDWFLIGYNQCPFILFPVCCFPHLNFRYIGRDFLFLTSPCTHFCHSVQPS